MGISCAGNRYLNHVEVMALQLRLFLVTCVTLVPQLEESTYLKGSCKDEGFYGENILDYHKDGNHEVD